jgi:sugar/nucleoside kinase (ribokinase family)
MSAVVVCGYTSIDVRLVTDALPRVGETANLGGEPVPAPQWGGCAPIVARWLRALGVPVRLVAWLGDDREGDEYRELLVREDVDVSLIETGAAPSPRSWLVSDGSGSTVCFFHPSGADGHRFADDPKVRADTDWLAVTVGPAGLTASLLDAFGSDARIAWDVKADRRAFPPELVRRLVGAELVCLNEAEARFVGETLELGRAAVADDLLARGAGLVAVTRGRAGALVAWADGTAELAPEQVGNGEPTGAGDAFFAGVLAALREGNEPVEACRRGLATATRHLSGAMR